MIPGVGLLSFNVFHRDCVCRRHRGKSVKCQNCANFIAQITIELNELDKIENLLTIYPCTTRNIAKLKKEFIPENNYVHNILFV